MIFKGFDENIYKDIITHNYKLKHKKLMRKYLLAMMICLLFILVTSTVSMTDQSDIIEIIFVLLAILELIFFIKTTSAVRNLKGWYAKHKNFMKTDMEIQVNELLQFHMKAGKSLCEINVIDQINYSEPYILNILGKFLVNGKKQKYYSIPYTLNGYKELSALMFLNKRMHDEMQFCNDSIKLIMHMVGEQRDTLFKKELQNSLFFIAACLCDDKTNHIQKVQIDGVHMSLSCQDTYINVYTSNEEIDKAVLKQYPLAIVVPLKAIINNIRPTESIVFQQNVKPTYAGICINPDHEHMLVSINLLEQLFPREKN